MKNFKFILILLLLPILVNSQTTSPSNTPFPGAFLGWNGAQDLDFKTNNINLMKLMQTGNATIDQYPVSISGNLALSSDPIFFSNGNKPFSLLHLSGEDNLFGPQMQGYRPWMRNGITFTNNGDLMYIGPMKKGSGTDKTDAILVFMQKQIITMALK